MTRVVYNAVFNSAKDYPKLEWVVGDDFERTRIWRDGKDTKWRHYLCLPSEFLNRSTTVKCIYYDENDEISVRIDVSDAAAKDMTEADVKRYVIEDMVRRLSYAVFCPASRNDNAPE